MAVDPIYDEVYSGDKRLRYIIISQERSGSNWLCARLINTKTYGTPAEYLNSTHMLGNHLKALGGPPPLDSGPVQINIDDYVSYVESIRTSRSGIFGMKVIPHQFINLYNNNIRNIVSFVARFDRVVLLDRKDRLGQAISGAIAKATNSWRSYGEEPDISHVDERALMADIAQRVSYYVGQQDSFPAWAASAGRPILNMTYEDMLAAPDETFLQLIRFIDPAASRETILNETRIRVPEPPPGRVAGDLRRKFLDYIEGRGRA